VRTKSSAPKERRDSAKNGGLAAARRELAELQARQAQLEASIREFERKPKRSGVVTAPLSCAQERMLFVHELDPDSVAYNFQATLTLEGAVDAGKIEFALNRIVERHGIFRTTIAIVDGLPVQHIHRYKPFTLDQRALPASRKGGPSGDEEVTALARKVAAESFRLDRLPLVRWLLVRLAENRHVLIHVEHHLIHDGWSFNLFLGELSRFYNEALRGAHSATPLPPQYSAFAKAEQEWLQTAQAKRQLSFWTARLAGSVDSLALPYSQTNANGARHSGASVRTALPVDLAKRIRGLRRPGGTTMFVTMLSGLAALFKRYSGQADFNIGTGIANRRWPESASTMGMFVNSTALRFAIRGNPTFHTFVDHVRDLVSDAVENQEYPFNELVVALNPDRRNALNPYFRTMFSFHDSAVDSEPMDKLRVTVREGLSNGSARLDLNIIVIPHSPARRHIDPDADPNGITMIWEYSSAVFDDECIHRIIGHYTELLAQALKAPDRPIDEYNLLSTDERRRLLEEWSSTASIRPVRKTLGELLAQQARRSSEAIAVQSKAETIAYAELNRRANQLAAYLREQGAGPESRIGICLERGVPMIVALAGIVKAGASYLPIDAALPAKRLRRILGDCGDILVLTESRFQPVFSKHAVKTVCVEHIGDSLARRSDAEPATSGGPDNLACVFYTSGTTGNPKGVMVTQRAIIRLVCESDYVDFGPQQTFLHAAPANFDAATFEIWGALLHGGRLIVQPDGPFSPRQLSETISCHDVTVAWFTSALFSRMVDEELPALGSLKYLLAGGDVLSPPHMARAMEALPQCKLINGYGPTECTTFAATYTLDPGCPPQGPIPIGKPIAGTELYVLDPAMWPVPIGVTGELFIGGCGLSRGYINAPELTAERFIPHPFSREGERLYRTGDIVRWAPDGNLEFLGRTDRQVKIRGFRVELGDVEAVLSRHPQASLAVVVARQTDVSRGKELVAYIAEKRSGVLTAGQLREYAKTHLPDYMIPSAFVVLERFPITANGKIDQAALPAPTQEVPAGTKTKTSPRNGTEQMLVDIWSETLRREYVGIHDNFFDLGGHSLVAMQVVSRIRDRLGVEMPLRWLFDQPVLSDLAARLAATSPEPTN
jgi:amino acid adenylation domain-containing protein